MYPIVEVERPRKEVLAAANVEQEHLFAGPGYPVRGGAPEGSGERRGRGECRVIQVEPPLAEEVEGEERHVVEAHGDDRPVFRRHVALALPSKQDPAPSLAGASPARGMI